MSITLNEALATLGINDVRHLKMKVVQKKFYQMSLIHHPDKPGGDTIKQQKLNEAYQIIGDSIVDNDDIRVDSEEEAARHVFKSFNFNNIKENIYSFTIKIDNHLSHIWDTVLSEHYGQPIDRNTNGKHWKHHNYTDDNANSGEISIGKWHIPKKDKQSKINIQSNTFGNLLPAHFVSFHFPKLLAEVKARATVKQPPPLTSTASPYTCNKCGHQSTSRAQFDTHMKRIHRRNSSLLTLPSTTSDSSAKPPKFVIHPPMNVLPLTPATLKCTICSSIFYKEEFLKEHVATMHKDSFIPKISTPEQHPCILCGKTFLDETAVTLHVKTKHEIQCTNCGIIFYDHYDLNLHMLTSHKSEVLPGTSYEHENELEYQDNLDKLAFVCILENLAINPSLLNSCPTLQPTSEYHGCDSTPNSNSNTNEHIARKFSCKDCPFSTTNESTLRNHIQEKHALPIRSSTLHCEFCPFSAPNKIDMLKHVTTKHAKLKCDQCIFTSNSQFTLDLHIVQDHDPTQPTTHLHPCTLCDETFLIEEDLNKHMSMKHSCTLCGITFPLEEDLNNHIQRRHVHQPDDASHVPTQHEALNLSQKHSLAMILEEQIDMAQTLNTFKDSVSAKLAVIQQDQEVLKNAIGLLTNQTVSFHTSTSALLETFQSNLQTQISSLVSSFSSNASPKVSSSSPQTNHASLLPTCTVANNSPTPNHVSLEDPKDSPGPNVNNFWRPPTAHPASRPTDPPRTRLTPAPTTASPSYRTTAPGQQKSTRLETSKRPKVLFIADSIGSNADIRHLEEATNSLIYTEKAYGSAYKPDALKPDENFLQVASTAPKKRNYNFAVLQSSSTDITNLNTTHHLEYLKQEVTISSKNTITAAQRILEGNPTIEKVLILERTPRFDTKNADPLQLKSELSDLANRVLRQELNTAGIGNRVFLGSHSLPIHLQENLYGHSDHYGYDGIHLRGPDGRNHFTRSLCNILQPFLADYSREYHNHSIPITSTSPCPPPLRSKPPPSTSAASSKPSSVIINMEPEYPDQDFSTFYPIPTYNRFSCLGN